MQTAIPAFGTTSWTRRLVLALIALALPLTFGFVQPGLAQNLTLSNNYFVTGDSAVGGVGLRGLGQFNPATGTSLASGTIRIPDPNTVPAFGVPQGADILAAYLYWETVESNLTDPSVFATGFFNGYQITGTVRGNPNAPTSCSTGGCSGNSQGSKTMVVYRADVRPYLPLDANGNIKTPNQLTPGSYQVKLPDSGSNGGGVPLTLGASLVIVYRVQSPLVPLTSGVIYDGAAAPSNSNSTFSQALVGFYQASTTAPTGGKLTHIVGNGQPNKLQSVTLNSAPLNSLYGGASFPAFPGFYNQNAYSPAGGGSWDNPTWPLR